VLADYLTRRGVAVLRVDDRGVGGSTGNIADSTTADLTGDVLAGIAFLKTRKEIDPKRIGLIGHSEGGTIAPMAAAQSDDVAFVVSLAGQGLSGEEILYLQGALLLKLQGLKPEAIASHAAYQKDLYKVLKEEQDAATRQRKLEAVIDKHLTMLPEEEKKAVAKIRQELLSSLPAVQTLWFRQFLTVDPRPSLRKVKCPVLALLCEKDFQVPPKENMVEIEKALKEGGNRDFTIKELPGLNHLFQTCETGNSSEYGKIEETFAPKALEIVGDWIAARFLRK
jgi:hypothetical protein